MTRYILIDTGLPKFLWEEICETAVFLINRSPHRALDGASLYAKLIKKKPNLSGLWAIGTQVFVHKEPYINKLEDKAWEGVMLGYGKDSRSYRIYNPHNRRIPESWNVAFIEKPQRTLQDAGRDKFPSSNGEQDETDYEYHQDVLAHLPLLDTGTGAIENKNKDKDNRRPLYFEGSSSPVLSMGSGGMDDSSPSPKSRGAPNLDGTPPDYDSGPQKDIESTQDRDASDTPSGSRTPPDDIIGQYQEQENIPKDFRVSLQLR